MHSMYSAFKVEVGPFRIPSPHGITAASSRGRGTLSRCLGTVRDVLKPGRYVFTSPWPDFICCEMNYFNDKDYVECHAGK